MIKAKRTYKNKNLEIFTPVNEHAIELPLLYTGLSAGFPSPAEDYIEMKLNLNKKLI